MADGQMDANDGRDDAWDVSSQCDIGHPMVDEDLDHGKNKNSDIEKRSRNDRSPSKGSTCKTQPSRSRHDDEMISVVGILHDDANMTYARNEGLTEKDFSNTQMAQSWSMIEELRQSGDSVDLESFRSIVNGRLEGKALERLERAVARWPGNRTLHQQAVKRVLLESRKQELSKHLAISSKKLSESATLEDMRNEIDAFVRASRDAVREPSNRITPASAVSEQLRTQIETPGRYMPTGIKKLDHVLGGGLLKKRLVSVTGQYKIGKTTLLSTLGYNMAHPKDGTTKPRKVIFITLERNQTDVEMLNASRHLGINQRELARHFPRHEKKFEAYRSGPDIDRIRYYHRPGAGIEEILTVLKQAREDHGCEVALLDYYQIIRKPKNARRVDHLMDVDQELAKAAEDLDMALVLAAQGNMEGLPKDSQSLLHSAAANFAIRRASDQPDAFLENLASNYIEQRDAGSPTDPAMVLNTSAGPHFADY